MGWSEQVDELLVSRGARPHRSIGLLLGLVCLVDLAAAICLREAPALVMDAANQTHTNVSWAPRIWMSAARNFSADTFDIIVLTLLRPLVLGFLCWLAIRLGTPQLEDLIKADGTAESGGSSSNGAGAPLLINAAPNGCAGCAGCASSSTTSSRSAAAAGLVLSTNVKEEHLASQKRKERAELRKNVVCGLMFLFTSAVQVFVGIKCIGFDSDWAERPSLRTVQAAIFLCTLALINLESFLAKRLVMVCTKEQGFMIPEFHPHRLFFVPSRPNARCDLCRNKTNQGAYVCRLCDFDCCAACFNKKDKATGEGIIRGDKGVKHVGALDLRTYMVRGVRLILPELPLIFVALSMLCADSMVRLFMPNYQGTIIQDIIEAHHACDNEAHNITSNATRGLCAETKASFLDDILTCASASRSPRPSAHTHTHTHAQVHPMRKCIPCICASHAYVHPMHTCMPCICASHAYVHPMRAGTSAFRSPRPSSRRCASSASKSSRGVSSCTSEGVSSTPSSTK